MNLDLTDVTIHADTVDDVWAKHSQVLNADDRLLARMLGLAGYDATTTNGTGDQRRARIHKREATIPGRRA